MYLDAESPPTYVSDGSSTVALALLTGFSDLGTPHPCLLPVSNSDQCEVHTVHMYPFHCVPAGHSELFARPQRLHR